MNRNRRRVIATLGVSGAALLSWQGYRRGVRFPPPMFEPEPLTRSGASDRFAVAAAGAAVLSVADGLAHCRAYAPEPEIHLAFQQDGEWELLIDNVRADTRVDAAPARASFEETHNGLQRLFRGRAKAGESLRLSARFYDPARYRFAAIGDTGGARELRWVMRRAEQLGTDFLLHLGDINYQPGDLESAARILGGASIPTYVTIGNHDYRDGIWLRYRDFIESFGPRNSVFELGGIRFVNLDTATGIVPAGSGGRGDLLRRLNDAGGDGGVRDTVVFTHKPLSDPRPEDERVDAHDIGGWGESAWMRRTMLDLDMRTLLCGHIHIKSEFDDEGVRTYISGQGLGHADLIVGQPIAEILLGEVAPGEPVRYRWAPLEMPLGAHCNARNWVVIDALKRPELSERMTQVCDLEFEI